MNNGEPLSGEWLTAWELAMLSEEAKEQEQFDSFYSSIPEFAVSECMNKKADMVEVVRCKDCKHRPKAPNWETYENGFDIEFPEGSKCPCQCIDRYYSWYPEDNWFCADGEPKEGEVND